MDENADTTVQTFDANLLIEFKGDRRTVPLSLLSYVCPFIDRLITKQR